MSAARGDFFTRIEEIALALSDDGVKDGLLTDQVKNAKARVLRNGLAVVTFTVIEDFIRQRTSEVLVAVGSSAVSFERLPRKLKHAATIGFLSTLGFRVKLQEDADKLGFIQTEARRIASTAGVPYELSPFALAHGKSNLDASEVKDVLSCLLVEDPWGSMTSLASRMNYGALPLEDAFMQAAKRRHMAAHQAGASTPLPDLLNFLTQARAIAAAFDCLISRSLYLLNLQNPAYMSGEKFNSGSCKIARVQLAAGKWKHYVEGRARAVSTNVDEAALVSSAVAAAHSEGHFLVKVDPSSRPVSWWFPAAA